MSKDEILELYLNKIYLGYRAYGVGAAAQVYFGKSVNQLTLSEMAMIAGLPKAPSTFNPLYSADRALARRNVVLSRMLDQHYITQQQYDEARSQPINASYHGPRVAFTAPYITEMVRQEMVKRYGDNAYTEGYQVYTTITERLQTAAQDAVRKNVIDYDMRHGYRGPERVLWHAGQPAWDSARISRELDNSPVYGPLLPAVVTSADAQSATVIVKGNQTLTLDLSQVRWARPFRSDISQGATPRTVDQVLQPGQLIRVRQQDNQWLLAQVPAVNSALVSLDSKTGAILALVGALTSTRVCLTERLRRYVRSVQTLNLSCIPPRWIRD